MHDHFAIDYRRATSLTPILHPLLDNIYESARFVGQLTTRLTTETSATMSNRQDRSATMSSFDQVINVYSSKKLMRLS